MNDAPAKAEAARACPICGQPRVERYRPFCSKRCADVDLARWLRGTYAVPAVEAGEPEDERAAPSGEDD